MAVGPGIACFGAGNEYAHGGVSLQEALVPILRVAAGRAGRVGSVDRAGGAQTARIAAVSWAGLRCRVRLDAAAPGLTVELRMRVGDPGSSIGGEARPVDEEGAASLLVADDEHEGKPAALVVLDARGRVVTRQATIIGGEG